MILRPNAVMSDIEQFYCERINMLRKRPHWDIYKWPPGPPYPGAGVEVRAAGLSVEECENALRKIDRLQNTLTEERRKSPVSAQASQQISRLQGQNRQLRDELTEVQRGSSAVAVQAQQAQLLRQTQQAQQAQQEQRDLPPLPSELIEMDVEETAPVRSYNAPTSRSWWWW